MRMLPDILCFDEDMAAQPRGLRLGLALYLLVLLFCLSGLFNHAPVQAASSPGPPPLDRVKLQLKWYHGFQFAGYYAAQIKGFYRAAGLDVTILEASEANTSPETTLSGETDFGIMVGNQALYDYLTGAPIVVLAVVYQHSPYVLLTRKDSGIRSPTDLIGRRVMISESQSGAVFKAMILREGLPLDQIELVPHTWRLDELLEGKVDASLEYLTDEPFQMEQQGVEPHILYPLDYGVDFYGDCLITTQQQARNHPKRVAAFREASLKGWEYAFDHVEEMIEYISNLPGTKKRGITPEHLAKEMESMQDLILPDLIEIGHMNPGRWKTMAEAFVGLGMVESGYSLKEFIYEPSRPPSHVWPYALASSVTVILMVILIAWFWNQQLRAAVRQRTRQLRDSEHRYRGLVNSMTDIVWSTNLHDRTTYINPAVERLLGYTPEEILSGESPLAMHPDFLHHAKSVFNESVTKQEGWTGLEVAYYHKDGSVRYFESSAHADFDADQQLIGFSGIDRDITDRKLAEDQLRESEAFRRRIFDSSRIPIVVMDGNSLEYIDCNPAAVEIYGFDSRETTLGKTPLDVSTPTQRDGRKSTEKAAEYAQLARDRGMAVFEWRHLRPSGEVWDAEVHLMLFRSGERELFQFTLRDITQQIRAQQELAETKDILEIAMDCSPSGILIADTGVRQFRLINKAALQILCGEAAFNQKVLKSQQHNWKAFLPDGSPIEISDLPLTRSIKTGLSYHDEEYIIRDETGVDHWVIANAAPLRNHEGKIIAGITIFHDITTRKQAQLDRERLEAQLHQSQKMEAVGQLAGGVAHDFNNLLLGIIGYTEMAMDSISPDEPVHEDLEQVMKSANRAKALVSQLLAFSRRQVLEIQDVDLNDVISDLMKMIRRLIGEHITLNAIPGHEIGIISADRGQIEQIVMNLCVNARDAMPDGGTISLETENVLIDEDFCTHHQWATPGKYVLLSITDTGCGMDKQTLERIFDPFFTTKDVGHGTGLGLSTVYGLVQQHKGMIHVYSEPGSGTTFKIYFPMSERSAQSVTTEVELPIVGGTETILLAEDDEIVREMTTALLEQAGYDVLAVADGQEAIELLASPERKPIDLALLDVMMPKVGGREVYEYIQQHSPSIRVLFASGYSMDAIHTNFVLDKGLQLIQKPYRRGDLLRRLRIALQ